MASQRVIGRMPKYRASCDSCQAMKVKCGQEKPSCRRCSMHKLDCIYSLSRRMGRPRARRSVPNEDTIQLRRDSTLDDNTTPTPTLVDTSANPDSATCPNSNRASASNTDTGGTSSSTEPAPTSELWTSTPTDISAQSQHLVNNMQDSDPQPLAVSMNSLNEFSPIDLNDATCLPSLQDILKDSLQPPDPQDLGSAPWIDLFDSNELISTRMSQSIDEGSSSLESSDIYPPPTNSTPARRDFGLTQEQQPGRTSHTKPSSNSSSAPSMSYTFDFSPKFLSDFGNATPVSTQSSLPVTKWTRASHCTCTPLILQRIGALKELQQKGDKVLIDNALQIESELKYCLSQLHDCRICCYDSSAQLLGLICARMVLEILQETVREEFRTRQSRRRTGWSAEDTFRNTPRSKMNSTSSRTQPSYSGTSVVDEGCNLYIGNFKVAPRTRSRFLHTVLQARFRELSVLISDWKKIVNDGTHGHAVNQQNFTRAAGLLLEDIEKGLTTVVGWVEVGNARDF